MAADGRGSVTVVVEVLFFGGGDGLVDQGVDGLFETISPPLNPPRREGRFSPSPCKGEGLG